MATEVIVLPSEGQSALDYATNLEDGLGPNSGLTKTEVGAVVFDTANAFVGVLNAGSATNMAKLL